MNDLFRTIRSGPIPFTSTVLALNVLTALIAFFRVNISIFAFHPALFPSHFWSVITYPFLMLQLSTNDLFNILIGGFFFWMSGGSLERSWGSTRFVCFFIGTAIISALSLYVGYDLIHILTKIKPNLDDFSPIYSFFLPMTATIVGFCSVNPRQLVYFMFFPLEARYLSIIAVAFTWVAFGAIYGFFACGGCLAAYLYVTYGRSWATAGTYKRHDNVIHLSTSRRKVTYLDGSIKRSPFDIIGKWRDIKEKRRLERLLRNSGLRDPEDDENRR